MFAVNSNHHSSSAEASEEEEEEKKEEEYVIPDVAPGHGRQDFSFLQARQGEDEELYNPRPNLNPNRKDLRARPAAEEELRSSSKGKGGRGSWDRSGSSDDVADRTNREENAVAPAEAEVEAKQPSPAFRLWKEGQYASEFTNKAYQDWLHEYYCGYDNKTSEPPEWCTMNLQGREFAQQTPLPKATSPIQLPPTVQLSECAAGCMTPNPEAEAFIGVISPFVPRRRRKPLELHKMY
jgi:hypothetical protein